MLTKRMKDSEGAVTPDLAEISGGGRFSSSFFLFF